MGRKSKYCCDSFEEGVREKRIVRAKGFDETEWYFPEWLHLYFCPFCGTTVKGKGFGTVRVGSI
jgi:hypothetical protein